MGATFSRIKTWIAEVLTAGDLNAEFDNILNNFTPEGMDDASENLAAMRTQRDVTGASLATDAAEEFHGLRFQLDALVGKTYWYEAADTSLKLQFNKGADIASATALPIGAATDGNYFDITGTTTITSFTTRRIGDAVRLHFDAILTLTHHATDLILPGASDITTAAGDEATFYEYATGDWRCLNYQRASGAAVISQDSLRDESRGLVITRPTNDTIDIDCDEVVLQTTAGVSIRVLSVNLTADITSSGANGLDTGSVASNTWYYVWVIYNPSTLTTASLLSTSSTAPTLPSGYTYQAFVGVGKTDGSSQLIPFRQEGRSITYDALQTVLDTAGATINAWTSLSITSFFPPIAKRIRTVIALNDTSGGRGGISPRSDGHEGSYGLIGAAASDDFAGVFPTARTVAFMAEIRYVDTIYYFTRNAGLSILGVGFTL